MGMTTTTDDTATYRRDGAPGQPAVLSHGRPGWSRAGNDMTTRPLSRTRAVLRTTSFKAGAAVLAASAAAALLAAPASAAPAGAAGCAYTYNFDYIQGQVDNCPGNGASAWAWLYVPNAGNAATGILNSADMHITYRNPSGQTQSYDLGTGANSTKTTGFYGGDVITQVYFCETFLYGLPPIYPFYRCSDTVNVP
jgi:hypothetical protein